MSFYTTLGKTVKLTNGNFEWRNGEPVFIQDSSCVKQHVARSIETVQGTDFLRPEFGLDVRSLLNVLRFATTEEARTEYIKMFLEATVLSSDDRVVEVAVDEVTKDRNTLYVKMAISLITGEIDSLSTTIEGLV